MDRIDHQLLGVDIGLDLINICRFDCFGCLHLYEVFSIPKPSIPGAVTVAICENIESVDPNSQADLVGVSVPGQIDSTGRTLISCQQLPGWNNIPLADWLEPRLSRKVSIVNSIKSIHLAESFQRKNTGINNDLRACLGASLLAYERLKSFPN